MVHGKQPIVKRLFFLLMIVNEQPQNVFISF